MLDASLVWASSRVATIQRLGTFPLGHNWIASMAAIKPRKRSKLQSNCLNDSPTNIQMKGPIREVAKQSEKTLQKLDTKRFDSAFKKSKIENYQIKSILTGN